MKCALVGKCVSKMGAFRKRPVSCDYGRARSWGRKVGGGWQGRGPVGGPAIWWVMEVAG